VDATNALWMRAVRAALAALCRCFLLLTAGLVLGFELAVAGVSRGAAAAWPATG
jgi:hypothetical protein